MNIKISVVVPTCNRPLLLLKCLHALAGQNFDKKNYEIIIVSDGPDQETEQQMKVWIKKRRSLRIRYFSLSEQKGPAAARNYGWLNAMGKLIAFTDDDCIPDRNWLKAFSECYTPGEKVAFTGKTMVPVSKRPTDYELNIHHLQFADFITANCCCPKDVLKAVGGFDERFTMAWREDSDLELKLINEGIEIMKVENAFVAHPVRKAAWGVSMKEQRKTMFNALLYKKYPEMYRRKIRSKAPLNYYLMVSGFALMMVGIALHMNLLSISGFIIWIGLTVLFTIKRLSSTILSIKHISEMVVTSLAIPFLSIFWQFYGAVKYRVLFI
jgi:glycosyltransferase involved in cell wall biosynthesis